MNEVIQINKVAQIREKAGLWLVRFQEGLTADEEKELRLWLDASRAHKKQLLELAAIWDDMEILTELAPLFDTVSPNSHIAKLERNKSWRAWAAAACAVLAFVSTMTFIQNDKLLVNENAFSYSFDGLEDYYKTAVGEHTEIRLSDGSVVTLNTDTQIAVNFTEKARNIRLIKGEAHFAVHKDPARPLSVKVVNKSVQAVGTAFSVRKSLLNNRLEEVAVDEGRVVVYTEAQDSSSGISRLLESSLNAGDVLTIVNDSPNITRHNTVEMGSRLAWKQGMIVFDDETLTSAIAKLSRYSEKRIILGDEDIGNTRVAGYFRVGDVNALMLALKENFGIHSTQQDENTIILTRI